MADADVPITAGAGTKIDTRTVGAGTDEHRQVVVVGDPTTAANVAAVSAAGAIKVDGSAVTQPVSLGAAVTIGAGSASIGTVLNVGDVDHDAVNTGKVVQMGGHASPQGTKPTAVATGDRVRQWLDPNGAMIIAQRQVPTYGAGYRLAVATAGTTYLAFTFVTNTDKQLATIYHAASATKTVRLRYASITLIAGAAGIYEFELRALSATTAPATGAPAVTPRQYDPADAAAEATCLALPTTGGSEAAANGPVSPTFTWNSAATAATADPARAGQELVLYDMRQGTWDRKPLTMRAGTAEGYAIVGRANGALAFNFTCYMEFTEE